MRRLLVLSLVVLAACGGDDNAGNGGQPPPAPAAAKPAKKAKAAVGAGRMHVEDSVACPSPEKATGPACDPANPTCEDGLYCVAVGTGHNCEPCPERDTIRHVFRERDFVEDQTRDPFRSPFQVAPGSHEAGPKHQLTQQCQRPDQLVATSWSYQDLHLVGLVARGTPRKVRMRAGNVGKMIKKGDCVGKERAIVKDIGTGFITFVIVSEDGKRPPIERSVPLYPNGLQAVMPTSQPPAPIDQGPAAPVIAPPGSRPAAPVIAPPPSK
jgi:Tfp pilus assembly protein PilP